MFTQELTISASELREFLLEKGYLHNGFKNAELIEINHSICKANDKITMYNCLNLTFEVGSLED